MSKGKKFMQNSTNLQAPTGKMREKLFFFIFCSIVGCLRFCKEHEDIARLVFSVTKLIREFLRERVSPSVH